MGRSPLLLLVALPFLALAAYHEPLPPGHPLGRDAPVSRPALSMLSARGLTCGVGFSACDGGYCISYLSACCRAGDGSSCPFGFDCGLGGLGGTGGTAGCCPAGQTCLSSSPTECASPDRVMCHSACIPSGAVCCDDGTYCDGGQTCAAAGGCDGQSVNTAGGPSLSFNQASGGKDTTVDSSSGTGEDKGDDGSMARPDIGVVLAAAAALAAAAVMAG